VRTAKAGNDEVGYSEALLGIDEEGWFPLRVRASDFETAVIAGESVPGGTARGDSVPGRAEAPEGVRRGPSRAVQPGRFAIRTVRESDCIARRTGYRFDVLGGTAQMCCPVKISPVTHR